VVDLSGDQLHSGVCRGSVDVNHFNGVAAYYKGQGLSKVLCQECGEENVIIKIL
jgi:hypothetical protein